MMREQIKYFGPLFFGLFSFLLYILFYRPAVGSEDFITALMVFCAALGWSAVIALTKEKKQWVLYLYVLTAALFPLCMALLFKGFNIVWHMVALGLIVLAIVGLRLFVSSYLKYKKEK